MTKQTLPHVILAPKQLDFSFGVDVHSRYEIDIPKERLEQMSPLRRKQIKGVPQRLTMKMDQREGPKWRPLPPLFMAGALTMSNRLAAILERFELPPMLIRPIEIAAPNDAARGMSFYSLTIQPHDPTRRVVIDRSTGLSREMAGAPQRHVDLPVQPGGLVLEAQAHGSLDLWRDPAIATVYFASGPLSDALIDAGMAGDLHLLPCALD